MIRWIISKLINDEVFVRGLGRILYNTNPFSHYLQQDLELINCAINNKISKLEDKVNTIAKETFRLQTEYLTNKGRFDDLNRNLNGVCKINIDLTNNDIFMELLETPLDEGTVLYHIIKSGRKFSDRLSLLGCIVSSLSDGGVLEAIQNQFKDRSKDD